MKSFKQATQFCSVALTALLLLGCQAKHEQVHSVSTLPPAAPQLTDAYLTDDRDNDIAKTQFLPQNEPVYFVFAATNVNHIPVKAVWFADSTDANPPHALSEEELTAVGPDYNGAFAHRPPATGWPPGNYHVDVYFGTALVHTEHFSVGLSQTPLSQNVPMENVGSPTPTLSPNGVLAPNVTPIPTETPSPGDAGTTVLLGVQRDAMGNPMISPSDGFQLHTSLECHGVQFFLEVNGKPQGEYEHPDMTSDISFDFHPGLNSIRISWKAPSADRECRMAIAIKRNHRLRTLTQVRVFSQSPTTGNYGLSVLVQ